MKAKIDSVLLHLVQTLMPQRLKILNYILQNIAKAAILPVLNLLLIQSPFMFYVFKDFKRQPNHIYGSQHGFAAKAKEFIV